MMTMKHNCPDGIVCEWFPRVKSPKECPRCKARLDTKKVTP